MALDTKMLSKVVLIATFLTVVLGGQAPRIKVLEAFQKTPLGSRFSNDVYEDAKLDVPDLISRYKYPVEVHHVTTADGYILEAHRIPHGKHNHKKPGKKPVVFLIHGLLSSSADFVVLGPRNALAYLLAEAGFDVWMGNARGNFYSRKHMTLNPDNDTNFWLFSWEQIGLYDIPAFVDYILELTGESQLHYAGHSQGGTVFLVLNSLKPEYNAKFKSFHGLAPASYFTYNENALYNQLAPFEKIIEATVLAVSVGEILSNGQTQALVNSRLCDNKSIFDPFCVDKILNASSSLNSLNSTMIPLFLSHAPAGASIRQVAHYAQVIRRGYFARFYHNPLTNLRLYGRLTPPEFNVSKIVVPSYLYYGLSDEEVDFRDLRKLSRNLPNVIETIQVKRESFNHFDFIWGQDVKAELYNRVINNIRKADNL